MGRRLLRNSERKAYLTCRMMWYWGYHLRLQSKKQKPALEFGSLIHGALEGWYIPGIVRGTPPWITFQSLLSEREEAMDEEFIMPDGTPAMELGTAMLKGYVKHWGQDEQWEVISPEMKFQVPGRDSQGNQIMLGDDELWHVGTGDIIVRTRSTRQIGVIETKTAAAIDTRHLGKDDQASSYWTLFPEYLQSIDILKPGEDIQFLNYNFLRKALPDKRPRDREGHYLNKDGSISKNQPSPLFERAVVWRGGNDRRNFIKRINNTAHEIKLVEDGRLPIIKNPSSAYPDKHCEGCQFRDMCDIHEIGSDWQEYARHTMTTWDPYEEHKE